MVKAIYVIHTKASVDDKWPFFPEKLIADIKAFKKVSASIGIIEYINKNIVNLETKGPFHLGIRSIDHYLVLDHYFVFPSDKAFLEHKNLKFNFVYAHIPNWKFDSESETNQYYADNHITLTLKEVDNPDLTDYILPSYEYVEDI